VLFNVVAMSFSVGTLYVSHDLLGLTSRLADNLSANVVGMALGTGFRYWSYRTYVFRRPREAETCLTGGPHGPAEVVRRRPGPTLVLTPGVSDGT
jgi:hypothetical protein